VSGLGFLFLYRDAAHGLSQDRSPNSHELDEIKDQ
jgi:hypothetical protein